MKRLVLGLALILLSALPAQRLFATQNCSTGDFSGAYGILAEGAVTVPGFPITGPFRRAGQVRADGNGNATFNTTASYNGLLFSEQISSTYTVSADCNIVFNVSPFAPIFLPATFYGFLSDNKSQVTFTIVSPPGQTISAVLRKQDAGGNNGNACNVHNLSKDYVLHMRGNTVNLLAPVPGQLVWEFVRVGKITFDGNGNFSAVTNAKYNGFLIQTENFSGTYTVASDCTISMQYTFQSVPSTWSGALIDNSQGADIVVSNPPGSAIAGNLSQE